MTANRIIVALYKGNWEFSGIKSSYMITMCTVLLHLVPVEHSSTFMIIHVIIILTVPIICLSTMSTTTTTTASSSPNTTESPETAKWTKYLPEAFGIRENVQNSPFRWCARESSLWGIATGTTMSL